MKRNAKCYGCYYFKQCDKQLEEKCEKFEYVFFTTKEDIELCKLMGCENIEMEGNDSYEN